MTTRTVQIPQQRRPVEQRTDGLAQVAALARDGVAGLPHTHRSPRRALIWAFWLLGIVGDAVTTLSMVASGHWSEGNAAAAAGMGVVGPTAYVVLASVFCFGLAVLSTGRPTGPVARVAVAFLLLVAAGKVVVAYSNLLLWAGVTGS